MQWENEGIVLAARPHGETGLILELFTQDYGRHAGFLRGVRSQKQRALAEPGNQVVALWRARLQEHLGTFTLEMKEARASGLMQEALSLSGLLSACALAVAVLPEREPYPETYSAFCVLLDHLHDRAIWPALYVRWELGLLKALGYGLDLSRCALGGGENDLAWVSPRTGRAACRDLGEPYKDKLFPLPDFLLGQDEATADDLQDGLNLSGYFLQKHIFDPLGKSLPDARLRLVMCLQNI